ATPRRKKQVLARVEALLTRFGIEDLADRAITEVSGGQLQRASICRALVCEPEIVFADEPTGSLNSQTTREVMDALTEVHADGTTLVLVTHHPLRPRRAPGRRTHARPVVPGHRSGPGGRAAQLVDRAGFL